MSSSNVSLQPNSGQASSAAAAASLDLEQKSKKVAEKISENLHIIANEPSLALFRLQEHVRKSLPQLVEKRFEVIQMHEELQGKCYDAEYAVNAVKAVLASSTHFQSIHDLLKNAIFMKQQLAYEENRKQDRKCQPSMYQRLSSLSLDLTDLPAALRPVAFVLSASTSAASDNHVHVVQARAPDRRSTVKEVKEVNEADE